MDSVFVALDLIRLTTGTDDPSGIACSRCARSLELHQLDVDLPARMLGTCERCKAWHLIDADAGLMVLLPDESDLHGPSGPLRA